MHEFSKNAPSPCWNERIPVDQNGLNVHSFGFFFCSFKIQNNRTLGKYLRNGWNRNGNICFGGRKCRKLKISMRWTNATGIGVRPDGFQKNFVKWQTSAEVPNISGTCSTSLHFLKGNCSSGKMKSNAYIYSPASLITQQDANAGHVLTVRSLRKVISCEIYD